MQLAVFLKRVGHVTGPSSAITRHTHLGEILNHLCGKRVSPASEFKEKHFHQFGRRLHEPFLQGKLISKVPLLSKNDIRRIEQMLKILKAHPAVTAIMQLCKVREKTKRLTFKGVRMQYTPDARGKKVGMDLKTTICKKLADFIKAAFDYGYFRQGYTYSLFCKLSDFYIVGICKTYPHKIFIVHLNAYPDLMDYAKNEFEFLHYFYKKYGSFKPQFKDSKGRQKLAA